MTRRIATSAISLGLAAAGWAAELTPSAAETALHALVDRQDAIFAAAEKAGKDVDTEGVRLKLQNLANDFEAYLKKNPDYGPGYAAYGLMLGRTDMRKESVAMFNKANQLLKKESTDTDVMTPAFRRTWAIVKNQLGNYTVEEGHPVEAVGFFLDAISLVPKEPLYHFQLGKLLAVARDDFIKTGAWTRDKLEAELNDEFRQAAELAPDRIEFAYTYAESFNEMEKPDWDKALAVWSRLEENAESAIERETMRIGAATVLIRQGKADIARALLVTIAQPDLQKKKDDLLKLAAGEGK